jgi:hypothetical protein
MENMMLVSSIRCKPSRWEVAVVRRATLDLGAVLAADCRPFFHLAWLLDGATVPEGPLILPEEHILAGNLPGSTARGRMVDQSS